MTYRSTNIEDIKLFSVVSRKIRRIYVLAQNLSEAMTIYQRFQKLLGISNDSFNILRWDQMADVRKDASLRKLLQTGIRGVAMRSANEAVQTTDTQEWVVWSEANL